MFFPSLLIVLGTATCVSTFRLGSFGARVSNVHGDIRSMTLAAHNSFASVKERYGGRIDLTTMADDEDGSDSDEISSYEIFAEIDSEMSAPPQVGQIIQGVVMEMDDNGALLQVGGKMPGYLPLKEAGLVPPKHVSEVVEIGQEISAEVIGTLRGMPVISFRTEQLVQAWEAVHNQRATDEPFEVEVVEVNRGGAVCQCFGLKAFLPGSHFLGVPDASIIGRKFNVKFLDVMEEEGKLVVSQKIAMAADAVDLVRGEVVSATVTGIRNYGAFCELDGGHAGLLHISQISYDRVDNLEQLFSIGQRIKVMILEHDKLKGRVALSTKTLEPNPGDMLRGDMETVFEKAEDTAKRYHARLEAERVAREEAAKEIVAGLGGSLGDAGADAAASSGGAAAAGGGAEDSQSASVAESIESILASIVADSDAPAATAPANEA